MSAAYYLTLVTLPVWAAMMAYFVARLLAHALRRYDYENAGYAGGDSHDYPDDRDDYAREQAIEDGRFEYER